ncbi:MAG: helix-turn-helix transcriptional regulator [Clostridia bacterium]|nr:helix-turn-helix transcriptional regulator [Clostridia bacterium]
MENEKTMIGERIRARRKQLGLTQAQLAEKLYITNKAVSKWETGEANPDLALLPRLAQVLGMSTDELLGMSKETPMPTKVEPVTAKERLQYAAFWCLAVLLGLLAILFLCSGLLAFDTGVVISATGQASDQLFLILFSLLLSVGFSLLLWPVAATLRKRARALNRERRARCAEQGGRLWSDLTKEEKKCLTKEFRQTLPRFWIGGYVLSGVLIISSFIVRVYHTLWGQLLYLAGLIVALVLTVILLRRERTFYSKKDIY